VRARFRQQRSLLGGVPTVVVVSELGWWSVDHVADLITYRCREESGYITGATYDVDGGSHIH
jgi:NAD(P)-dependent dehydrogenase (short-subunit alcohol dehydrogenase family)